MTPAEKKRKKKKQKGNLVYRQWRGVNRLYIFFHFFFYFSRHPVIPFRHACSLIICCHYPRGRQLRYQLFASACHIYPTGQRHTFTVCLSLWYLIFFQSGFSPCLELIYAAAFCASSSISSKPPSLHIFTSFIIPLGCHHQCRSQTWLLMCFKQWWACSCFPVTCLDSKGKLECTLHTTCSYNIMLCVLTTAAVINASDTSFCSATHLKWIFQ